MIILIITIIILFIIIVLKLYNTIVKLHMKVNQSKSGIDVYCQQRFDLIPNLIEVVKRYMNYEKDGLEQLTKLRMTYNTTKDIKVSEELNNQMNRILITTENYPELKASEHFLNLQRNLTKMESQLQAARRIYNNDVTNYNTKINIVPYNIVAKIFRFKEEPLFKIEVEDNRNNLKI